MMNLRTNIFFIKNPHILAEKQTCWGVKKIERGDIYNLPEKSALLKYYHSSR